MGLSGETRWVDFARTWICELKNGMYPRKLRHGRRYLDHVFHLASLPIPNPSRLAKFSSSSRHTGLLH